MQITRSKGKLLKQIISLLSSFVKSDFPLEELVRHHLSHANSFNSIPVKYYTVSLSAVKT